MTYEEWYKELQRVINNTIGDYKHLLKTEVEDIRQEAYILIFEIIDKLNEIQERGASPYAYYKQALKKKLAAMRLEEHKQLLHMEVSDIITDENGEEVSLIDLYMKDNNELLDFEIYDECIDKRKKYLQEYYIKNKEKMRQQHKEYYQKNKERIIEQQQRKRNNSPMFKEKECLRSKKYYWENREKVRARQNKHAYEYYHSHPEEMWQRGREYYTKHKDEILKRRKEDYQKKKLNKLKEEFLNEN